MAEKRKIGFLLGLLGRKRPIYIDQDPEFEDISEIDTLSVQLATMLKDPPIAVNEPFSASADDQRDVENEIYNIYSRILDENAANSIQTAKHLQYINRSLNVPLSHHFFVLDANHSWMVYWLLNARQLFSDSGPVPAETALLVSQKISENLIKSGAGGVGGGAHQMGHVATTYALVLALILAEDWKTLEQVRGHIYPWLLSLKQPNGAFSMYINGESDARSTYCVLVVASLLNLLTEELVEGTLSWLNSCQTYEGGFAGVPNTEAHGGYTFCAFASYFLLAGGEASIEEALHRNIDVNALLSWLVQRQYQIEGGLSGRTNKLVDACYSFWVGGVFPLLEAALDVSLLVDREALKAYIVQCAQEVDTGGFKDKPGKSVDFYHTNYALSGLSITHYSTKLGGENTTKYDRHAYDFQQTPLGDTPLKSVHPVFCLPEGYAEKCQKHFAAFPAPEEEN